MQKTKNSMKTIEESKEESEQDGQSDFA